MVFIVLEADPPRAGDHTLSPAGSRPTVENPEEEKKIAYTGEKKRGNCSFPRFFFGKTDL